MDPNTLYYRRKRSFVEYRNLFTALSKIPDDDVRQRVTIAINGGLRCTRCDSTIMMQEASTQTLDTDGGDKNDMNGAMVWNQGTPEPNQFEKKRRRRKRNFPKVVKESQHAVEPVLEQEESHLKTQIDKRPAKVIRTDSQECAVESFFNSGPDIFQESPEQSERTVESIKEKMQMEWETSDKLDDGYLPIHTAIILNEQKKLRRQIYVWNYRGIDIHQLVTDSGDNPLQLAIKHNCLKYIFDILLAEKPDLNSLDDNQNTIIHLAVSNLKSDEIQPTSDVLQVLERLMKGVDLQMLLEKNDDGLTPLQIAVKNKEYRMAEKILNVLDERLGVKKAVPPCDPSVGEMEFLKHYCELCDDFEGREKNMQKSNILNATSMKSGSTALFQALELGYNSMVYLLIAHLSDPGIKNFAGIDAKMYYLDRGKNSSVIAALDKVSTFLWK